MFRYFPVIIKSTYDEPFINFKAIIQNIKSCTDYKTKQITKN